MVGAGEANGTGRKGDCTAALGRWCVGTGLGAGADVSGVGLEVREGGEIFGVDCFGTAAAGVDDGSGEVADGLEGVGGRVAGFFAGSRLGRAIFAATFSSVFGGSTACVSRPHFQQI